MEYTTDKTLKKSKSLLSLPRDDRNLKYKGFCGVKRHRTCSDSSADVSGGPDDAEGCKRMVDSGIGDRMLVEGDILASLEQKIDSLSEAFLEQCGLLNMLKQDIRNSKAIMEKTERAQTQILVNVLKKDTQRFNDIGNGATAESFGDARESANSRAKSLLSAIEAKQGFSIDHEVREGLIKFLQSDELKEQMVRATAASVKDMIDGCFSKDVSSLYLPVLERTHKRHLAHIHRIVEQAFDELEEKSSSLFESVYRTSDVLRRALERHQGLLAAAANPGDNVINTFQYAVEEVLHKELSEWRQKVLQMFTAPLDPEPLAEVTNYLPTSPPQPAGPGASIIDQLMKTAFINKKIQEGDVNGSFERALSAADLSLVMAACRRADPAAVFTPPCSLKQHVLLSLVQQLATDMVHETHLKCRYLEEAIINLNTSNPDTRAHLPLVVGEVKRHLNTFLASYPNHAAGRRITLIVMAANNLLK